MSNRTFKSAPRVLLYIDMGLILTLLVSVILLVLGLFSEVLLLLVVILFALLGPVSSVTVFLTGVRLALERKDTTLGSILVFSLFACLLAILVVVCVDVSRTMSIIDIGFLKHGPIFDFDLLVELVFLGSYLYAFVMAPVVAVFYFCRKRTSSQEKEQISYDMELLQSALEDNDE